MSEKKTRLPVAMPTEVEVMGKVYSVEVDDDLMDDGTASGLCKPWRCSIRLGIGMHRQQRRDTLLHEVVHAIFSETGLTGDFGDDDEERIVRRLSTGLLQVLRANPHLIKLLVEKD